MKKLYIIRFTRNNGISSQHIGQNIMVILDKFQHITDLQINIFYCDITDDKIQKIAVAIQKCKNLKKLDLNLDLKIFPNQSIGAGALKYFQDAILNCESITYLKLNTNQISFLLGDYSIILAIRSLKNLNNLTLFLDNCINDAAALNIGIDLEKCSNLNTLKILVQFGSLNMMYYEYTQKAKIQLNRSINKISRLVKKN
ncbi:hypothetical protein ABPG72_019315 [Tetrahymena utriculariae]